MHSFILSFMNSLYEKNDAEIKKEKSESSIETDKYLKGFMKKLDV